MIIISLLATILAVTFLILWLKEKQDKDLNAQFNNQKISNLTENLSKITTDYQELERRYHNLNNLLTASNTRLQNEIDKHKNTESIVNELQKNLENITLNIFQKNQELINKQSKENLSVIVTPLQENIKDFREKIEKVHIEDTKERTGLKTTLEEQIKNIVEVTKNIGTQANSLAMAIKGDKKMQGNWGEKILTDILQHSGLQEGISYTAQSSGMKLINEEGDTLRPDIIIKLSEDKSVILDAKMSLNNYEQYIQKENTEEKEYFLQLFIKDVKNHIDNLSSKQYDKLSSENKTVEFIGSVMLFIPLESTYYEILHYQNGLLHEYAWKNGIVIVGPYNLMPILKVIDNLSKIEQQNKNAKEIARIGSQMYDKFVLLLEGVQKFRKNIDNISKNFDEDVVKKLEGKGNLINRAEEMKKLGIKTEKNVPQLFEEN